MFCHGVYSIVIQRPTGDIIEIQCLCRKIFLKDEKGAFVSFNAHLEEMVGTYLMEQQEQNRKPIAEKPLR